MQDLVSLNAEEAEEIVAFIKSHEREDIPDEIWDICMNLMDFLDGNDKKAGPRYVFKQTGDNNMCIAHVDVLNL